MTDRFDGLPAELATLPGESRTTFAALSTANLVANDALNRFDFSGARRQHEETLQRSPRGGPFLVMHSHCVAGLAAREQLDIAAAGRHFTDAMTVSARMGGPSRSSILAGALLGGLRYEQGDLEQARALLDASARLDRQGGPVDFLLATFGSGTRVAALIGDLAAA
ncbi:hypothetical protein ACFYOW_16085 [Nocardia sp. NPDC006982]|uniref:hypothetical protein n=1 Tax=Nocardia sp. NPDC006982 TaxID=3364307 RepID=UPI0036864835